MLTISAVDLALALGAAWGVGILTGAAAVAALRARAGEAAAPAGREPDVPPGVESVLSALSASAVLLDGSDDVLRASPAAYRLGLVRGNRFVHEALLELARRTRRDGEIRTAELELARGPLGAGTHSVAARVAPLGSELVLVLVDDRTESRRIDDVRRDFVENVSHELKTPVGALILLAEAVLGASDDPDAVRRFAGRMQHEAARLSNLVQELIDLSRLQWDDPLSAPNRVDLDLVVAHALDRCRLTAQAKQIELVATGEADVEVRGDEEQLVTALRNLIDNAVSYSPDGTRVTVAVRRSADLVELAVTDQGFGIPERDLARIFERFYRVDPARSRATGGTGLGLSIVKHVVANHGGEVTVWSDEGSGSTFTIRLPAEPAHPRLVSTTGDRPTGDPLREVAP